MTPRPYLIFSLSEHQFDGAGFWSNNFGWSERAYATPFSEAEREAFDLPIPSDSEWVPA